MDSPIYICDGVVCRYDFPDDTAWLKYQAGDKEWVEYVRKLKEGEELSYRG